MEAQNASQVWPDSVRPLASVIVPEITSGSARRSRFMASRAAAMAALALRVSNTVSIIRRSTPPAISARAALR